MRLDGGQELQANLVALFRRRTNVARRTPGRLRSGERDGDGRSAEGTENPSFLVLLCHRIPRRQKENPRRIGGCSSLSLTPEPLMMPTPLIPGLIDHKDRQGDKEGLHLNL